MATYNLVVTGVTYKLVGGELTVSDGGPYGQVGGKAEKQTHRDAEIQWEARDKWRKQADELLLAMASPKKPKKGKAVSEPVALDDLLPRLNQPSLSLPELLADAKLLQIEQAAEWESALALRDAERLAELAYLMDIAVEQEKDAIAAFMFFMDA